MSDTCDNETGHDHPLASVLEDEIVVEHFGKTDSGNHLFELNNWGMLILLRGIAEAKKEADA